MTDKTETDDLDTLYGKAQDPKRVKDHERPTQTVVNDKQQTEEQMLNKEVRLNLGWVTPRTQKFAPQQTVRYLWVVTDEGELVVGVEDALNNPDAFEPGQVAYLKGQAADLGHPTLAADFVENDGRTVPGQGRIGGELFYQNGSWAINNASGRYSKDRTENMLPLLANVAKLFQQYCGIDPKPELKK